MGNTCSGNSRKSLSRSRTSPQVLIKTGDQQHCDHQHCCLHDWQRLQKASDELKQQQEELEQRQKKFERRVKKHIADIGVDIGSSSASPEPVDTVAITVDIRGALDFVQDGKHLEANNDHAILSPAAVKQHEPMCLQIEIPQLNEAKSSDVATPEFGHAFKSVDGKIEAASRLRNMSRRPPIYPKTALKKSETKKNDQETDKSQIKINSPPAPTKFPKTSPQSPQPLPQQPSTQPNPRYIVPEKFRVPGPLPPPPPPPPMQPKKSRVRLAAPSPPPQPHNLSKRIPTPHHMVLDDDQTVPQKTHPEQIHKGVWRIVEEFECVAVPEVSRRKRRQI